MFAVPTVCQVFFQPLSLRLAYHGFSEQCGQCEQQDNGHHEQDHQYIGIMTMNKASGGNGFPVELFQILKDDAVKVLHLLC